MPRFYTLETGLEPGGSNVLEIMHEIDTEQYWEGQRVSASNAFRAALNSMTGDMNVLINSPGGDTFAGADMYAALREYSASRGRVRCFITGVAASAASIVAMAGDEIIMSPSGLMMIHDPWTCVCGNAAEMREMADVLDIVRDGVAAAYVARTGKTAAEIRDMMARERWMTASAAIADGFADRTGFYEGPRAKVASAARDVDPDEIAGLRSAAEALKKQMMTFAASAPPPDAGTEALRRRMRAMCAQSTLSAMNLSPI